MRSPLLFPPPLLLAALLACLPTSVGQAQESKTTKTVKPFNVPVNTPEDEDDPHVSADGLTLYYTGTRKGKEELMVARRKAGTLPWPAKGVVLEDYVSTPGQDRSAFATTGAYPQYLYFGTTKDPKQKNYDLYAAVKQDFNKAWSAPTPLQAVASEEDELHPWVSADGKSLYFSRKNKDGWRLYHTTRAAARGPAGWAEPKPVAEIPAGYHHATLSPDGKTMYLQGPVDKDRWSLFVSQRTTKGWSEPQALDEINDPDAKLGDRSPNLSRDGRFLYWSSDRSGGKGGLDLWGIPVTSLNKR